MVVLRDFPQFIVDHQITFMRRFRRGVPQDFRWTVWKAALQWEVMRDRVGIPYASLIGTTNKFSELITIDAPRTFPEIACFDALAEHEIYNILVSPRSSIHRTPSRTYTQRWATARE
ncbi:MAG: uncharacterized protein KVP18_002283 [Porospora cf. gigantea A]|uniref:uncharacterized protein n=1 Tax=Porospora cf. gigantea A TaxID=2853593 RepID=UPI00355A806E|nr:MAG: hypothetical protein KVP18_002283 [Porospora cf. gigantea A]